MHEYSVRYAEPIVLVETLLGGGLGLGLVLHEISLIWISPLKWLVGSAGPSTLRVELGLDGGAR